MLLAKLNFSLLIWDRQLKFMLQHPTVWLVKQSKYPSKELLLYESWQEVMSERLWQTALADHCINSPCAKSEKPSFLEALAPIVQHRFFYISMFILVKWARICLLSRKQPRRSWPKKLISEATLHLRLHDRRDKRVECQSTARQKRHTWTPSASRDHMLAESYCAALQMETGQKFLPFVPHEFS